jgi:hypothetical protein
MLQQIAAEQSLVSITTKLRDKCIVGQITAKINTIPFLDVEMVDRYASPNERCNNFSIYPRLNNFPERRSCASNIKKRGKVLSVQLTQRSSDPLCLSH